MSTIPRLIRLCCNNQANELEILRNAGYRVSHGSLIHNYLYLNIWTLEAVSESKQRGYLLSETDLAAIALLPSIDAVEQYIYMLQDEAAVNFNEAKKE